MNFPKAENIEELESKTAKLTQSNREFQKSNEELTSENSDLKQIIDSIRKEKSLNQGIFYMRFSAVRIKIQKMTKKTLKIAHLSL